MIEYMNQVFTPRPMLSFLSARNLPRDKLFPVRRKVAYFECKGEKVSCGWDGECLLLSNSKENVYFSSRASREEYKIHHCFNCNETYLIYLFTCKVFLKQYIGPAIDEFRLTWNNCKRNSKKHQQLEKCIEEHVFEHFNDEVHNNFLEDVSVSFIDKTDFLKLLKRENCWKNVSQYLAALPRPLKIYFTLYSLFVLIFLKFLSWLLGQVEKRVD